MDLTFDTSGLGLDGTVWAVAPQSDGKVVIGGDFTMVGGASLSRIARLNADGSLDTTFNPGLGANDTVYTLLVQGDGNILVGGAFTQFHTANNHGLTRLLPSGTLDPSFSPGSSANDVVYSVFYSATESRIYVGGMFTEFNSTRRVWLARLFTDGTVDTSFLDTAYNQFAGLINPLFNPDLYPHNVVYALGQENVIVNSNNVMDLVIAGSFDLVGGGGGTRHANDHRENLALLRGGATTGPGNISFAYPDGSGLNNADKYAQYLQLTLTRVNGTLGTVATRFSPDPQPVGPGAAIYGQDYTFDPTTFGLASYGTSWTPGEADSRMKSDGIWWFNYPDPLDVFTNVLPAFNIGQVDIVNNTTASGNRSYNLNLSIPEQADSFFLGGANIPLGTALGPETSTPSQIIDNRNPPGTFSFIMTNYTVSEKAGSATIMVIRTNGSSDTVTLTCLTQDLPGTPPPGIGFARSNFNYKAVIKSLTFYPGITNQSFNVPILDDGQVDPDLALLLVITNITAQHPMNGTALGGVTNAWLTIIDADFPGGRLNFSYSSFATNETAGNAIITVTREGESQGALTVLASTTNTTASANNTPAVPGVNYFPVSTNLVWTNYDSAPKSFMVPVLHDGVITPNLTVGLQLSTAVLNGVTNPVALGLLSNATLTILNVDSLGTLSFSSPTYVQNENGGFALIPVVRQGGSVGSLSASFSASAYSNVTAGIEFVATNGSLTFGPGEVSKVFTVPLIDNHYLDLSNRAVVLQLTNSVPAGVLGSPSTALLSIVSDGFNVPPGGGDPNFSPSFNGPVYAIGLQPDGSIVAGGSFTVANVVTRNRLARLNADGTLDFAFAPQFASQPGGADNTVRTLALQTDGRILIGGDFMTYYGINRSHFARVNLDGTLDSQFDPGSGLDQSAYAVVETFTDTNQTVRKILVGGSFTLANGAPRNYLAQFNDDGSVDLGFNAANGANGLNGPVWAIAVQGDHKIIVGGDFTSIGGAVFNHIARLNADGSLDYSFNNPGTGASDSVRALAIELDGSILVGGLFTNFNGTVQNRIVRLNADGSLDPTFNGGVGGDGAVYAIALQPDNRILLGGEFTRWGGVTRNHLTRLNPDGSVDTAINFGAGCDNFVASVVVQTNDSIVLGGGFTTYDGASAPYLTRIFGRSIAGSGTFEFTSAAFGAYETATNAVITLRRRGGTSATASGPNVYVTVATSDGYPPNGAINGTNYLGGLFTNTFPPGETFGTVLIPVLHDFQVTPDLTVNLQITDIEPLGLGGLGNQPIATLYITNVDSAVHFSAATYSIAKNDQAGRATIPIYRLGSTVETSQVEFMTTGGTAQGRYIPVDTNIVFNPGDTVLNAFIPIINDNLVLGDETVTMALANPVDTLLSTPSTATLTIIETSTATGTLAFSAPSYVVSEQGTNAYLNVLRNGGVTGLITADYFTRDGTALAGVKYVATNGTLVFANGETSKTIIVPIINDTNVTGNEVFSVVLTNATGGATFTGPTTVPVTIIDENVGISFASPIYVVSETAGTVALAVLRQNGTNAVTTVHYSTTNLTASAGTNYVAINDATLTFNPGETVKNFTVQVLHDPRVTGNLSFAVNLFNPSAPAQLFNYTSAVVNVLDADTGLSFGTANRLVITNADLSTVTNASYSVLKSGTNVLITIVRSNANTGVVSINYATATNANDNAVAGVDYGPTSGLLTFSNNVALQSFVVPIFNNRQVEGNRTFSVNLFNATGGAQLLGPPTATVTIIDDVTGISFSSSNYRVNENGGAATITVLRTNYVNSIVSVDYATTAGTAQPGINYSNVTGTLTFNPGETVKTFSVPVVDDGVLNGDTTVHLSLANLVGNAVFVNPSAATLTVVETDGSLVVPAGSALISESGPVNGVIDPGETVTVLFALRNSTGTNTVNLVATMLATNGVSNPSGGLALGSAPTSSYGTLVVHGPSVSRPFTFTASATNGQIITATFQLQDGSVNRGLAVFNFTVGQTANRFANLSAITIPDPAAPNPPWQVGSGPATPYPSTINVKGLGGLVTKATVTLTNLNHTWPSDIDILLVSPTGQNSYLMAKCGSSYAINNVTLTFDDTVSNSLPQFGQIVSGTNRTTSYALATPPFPAASTPPPPYNVGLSNFNGNNPNGNWSLYALDDSAGMTGAISNGWILNLTTAGVVPAAADVGLAMTASTAAVVATSNLTYTLTLTNYGPSAATSIVVTDALPAGMAYVSSSPSVGSVSNIAGFVTWTIPSLAKDAVASLALVVQANSTGTITNLAAVTTGTPDLNPDDSTALAVVVVSTPTADLAIGLSDSPNPLSLGGYLTYTITVSNLGPATATGVIAVDTLPPAVNFISASPADSYTVAGGIVTFTNLGDLGSGAQTSVVIVAQPTAAGTIIDSASCRSGVIDPLKANNSASVKTIVQSLSLTVLRVGANFTMAWPIGGGNYILETTTDLMPPAVWTPVTNPPPTVVGGQSTVTIPIGSGSEFFRLHATP
ncbi:MAG: Calx-beta domain-containing protein [Terriglobia bacterium]